MQVKVKLLLSLCLKFSNHLNSLNLTWVTFVGNGIQWNAFHTEEETENPVEMSMQCTTIVPLCRRGT